MEPADRLIEKALRKRKCGEDEADSSIREGGTARW